MKVVSQAVYALCLNLLPHCEVFNVMFSTCKALMDEIVVKRDGTLEVFRPNL